MKLVFEKVSRLKAKDRLTQRAQMKWEVKREKKIENDSEMKSRER